MKEVKEGFIAISKGKALRNYWVGSAQTGTNKQALTEDFSKASIAETKEELNTFIYWYNHSHRIPVNFTITHIRKTVTTEVEVIL